MRKITKLSLKPSEYSYELKNKYRKCKKRDLIDYIGSLEELLIFNAGSFICETNKQLEMIQNNIFNKA